MKKGNAGAFIRLIAGKPLPDGAEIDVLTTGEIDQNKLENFLKKILEKIVKNERHRLKIYSVPSLNKN